MRTQVFQTSLVVGLRAVGRVREVGKERAGSEEIGGNHTIMCNILQIEKGQRREPTKRNGNRA